MQQINKLKPYRPQRGDYVAVLLKGHDGNADCYSVRRAVRVSRTGRVTHVCTEAHWGYGNNRANGSTALTYQWVRQVFLLDRRARIAGLSLLADGSVWGGGFETAVELRRAVLGIENQEGIRRAAEDRAATQPSR